MIFAEVVSMRVEHEVRGVRCLLGALCGHLGLDALAQIVPVCAHFGHVRIAHQRGVFGVARQVFTIEHFTYALFLLEEI